MKYVLPISFLSMALLSGCETMQTPQQRKETAAREQAAQRRIDERIRRLEGSVEGMTSDNARLSQEVQVLRSDIYTLNQQLGTLGASVQSLDQRQARDKQEISNKVLGTLKSMEKQQKAAQPKSSGMRVHTVESGHTLSAIASAYKTTVKSIKSANNLSSDTIQVGQKLYIPQ